jgi:AraC family transcriptional regulator
LNSAAAESYYARFRKTLEYIDAHLHEDLDVEQLGRIAAFSKFHFHRQFTELFGIGVSKYIQLKRLKRASYRLAFRERMPIIDVALASGYESPEAFARAFKKSVGQTPSEFRQQPQWNSWHATYRPLSELRSLRMKTEHRAEQVKIVNFPATKIAVLEHRGPAELLGDSIRRFIEWRRRNNLPPRLSATFNILYDDPEQSEPEHYRFDLCAATQKDVVDEEYGIVTKVIPDGRCAVLRLIGSDDGLGDALSYLYSKWLPQSGEEPRDFPPYLQRVSFFPDVPEHEAIVDIFLPLK